MRQVALPELYGIIGYPLGHSLSPLLHSTAFQDLNIAATLLPWATPPEKLSTFMEAMRLLNIRGCCVTIPHKQAVMPYLDQITPQAQAVGAVNLLYWDGDQLFGDNTDVDGFIAPLQPLNLPAQAPVLILGSGGAARAAIVGLQKLGLTNINITNHNPQSAQKLAAEFQLHYLDWSQRGEFAADLLINTTPLGMQGKLVEQTPYQAEWFQGRQAIAYDIVYTPYLTRFLAAAQAADWQIISGLAMFLGQAEAQFKTWTGQSLSAGAKQLVYDRLLLKSA